MQTLYICLPEFQPKQILPKIAGLDAPVACGIFDGLPLTVSFAITAKPIASFRSISNPYSETETTLIEEKYFCKLLIINELCAPPPATTMLSTDDCDVINNL